MSDTHHPHDPKYTYDDHDGEINPSTFVDYMWVRFYDPLKMLEELSMTVGMWMLFYPTTIIDAKWKALRKLYENDELDGILSIKCSTNNKNQRSSYGKDSVIFCNCGPVEDEQRMLRYGENLIKVMEYTSPCGYMRYKKEVCESTKGTKQRIETVYEIKVPMS